MNASFKKLYSQQLHENHLFTTYLKLTIKLEYRILWSGIHETVICCYLVLLTVCIEFLSLTCHNLWLPTCRFKFLKNVQSIDCHLIDFYAPSKFA